MLNKNIIENNFYYISSHNIRCLNRTKAKGQKKDIENIIEYEELITELTNKNTVKIFKMLCRSILIKNEGVKCIINDAKQLNLIGILCWLLYHINYNTIEIDMSNYKINDLKNGLKKEKKVIILRVKHDYEFKKAIDIVNKYPNENIIIKNYSEIKMNNFSVLVNISIKNYKLIEKYMDINKDIYYDIYDLLDREFVILIDWINNNDMLQNIFKKNDYKYKT